MKLGSLFDGSGGFPLAGSLCGIEPVWASEVEPYPIAVTKSRFPNMKHLGSVTEVHGAEVDPVDIITFGSPCQDLSVAGKRAGLKHEANGDEETTRSGLFMEAVRIIKEMRKATNGEYPTFAVWENVPGAFSSNKGEDFRTVLEELIKIVEPTAVMPAVPENGWPYADSYCGDGWSLAYRVFNAQYWGVPQRRRRIYLALDLRGQRAGKVSFECEGLRGNFAESGTPWKAVAGDVTDCAGTADKEKCYGIDGYNSAMDEVAATIGVNCGMSTGRNGVLILNSHSGNRMDGADAANRAGADDCEGKCVTHTFQNTGQGWWNESGVGTTLRTPCGGDSTLANVVVQTVDGNILDDHGGQQITVRAGADDCEGKCVAFHALQDPISMEELSPCITNGSPRGQASIGVCYCAGFKAGNGTKANGEQPIVAKGSGIRYIVRRLTPTEFARLQGFQDDWGHPDYKEDFTDEEYRFWLNVRNTHATINGKPQKDYTKAQMLTWYNKLHTDSSEYKMWGNGISLPTALYVMQGISEALKGGDGRRWQG